MCQLIRLAILVLLLITANIALSQDAKCPFPQHTVYEKHTLKLNKFSQPVYDKAVETFYEKWKSHYVRHNCSDASQYYVFDDEDAEKRGTVGADLRRHRGPAGAEGGVRGGDRHRLGVFEEGHYRVDSRVEAKRLAHRGQEAGDEPGSVAETGGSRRPAQCQMDLDQGARLPRR